jgi:hypothetical protein
MANLKIDLLNELRNQKYYEEIELLRLAQDPSMNYKEKIVAIKGQLEKIALLNNELALAEAYFPEPQAQQPVAPAQAPVDENLPQAPAEEQPQVEAPVEPAPQPQQVSQPQPGQSHGE